MIKERFKLDPQLEKDSFYVADLNLSQLRLINNKNYIWFIVVPKINNITHITELSTQQQIILMQEINLVADILTKQYQPTRFNIAAIGNVVSQMHWHVIVRYDTDPAWPKPVWGMPSLPYTDNMQQIIIDHIKNALSCTI